ncbi:uncharacterized protein LOC122879529 isoform X2 [Siniperca chuatsi]|uniref:uncharacterized protein LOC122879529 isoform X2 n=2 Tax=Siniperca chuatsi TaxID=119488 RepID=UPI001CE152FB|nr:uncharacterized protein LOC122879529 isoform X2 [Siniperca chuatsi]
MRDCVYRSSRVPHTSREFKVYLMATDGCSPAIFFCTCENAFYFEAAKTDVVEDNFKISDQHCKHLIRSEDNKFLLLNAEGQFQVQNLTTQQQCQADCKFNIQIYKESSQVGRKGRAVMLYANRDGKKIVACCNEKHEIYPEAMDLPQYIGETAHKAVFYLMHLANQTNKFMFESSLYPAKFLGFEPIGDNPSLAKLVLRHKGDEVDESCEVSFSDCHAFKNAIVTKPSCLFH